MLMRPDVLSFSKMLTDLGSFFVVPDSETPGTTRDVELICILEAVVFSIAM
jgi:hypothetical protein